ncbi:hypothetical protein TIFTF001_015170 [Ficus carica]|uniref:Oleosin n=1 Tax=Ficus carica TaxID=3494 RepID=A0AA88DIL1_FICCA|nr:hypothetical protein TIFTF001_015170 [Ficus carica]
MADYQRTQQQQQQQQQQQRPTEAIRGLLPEKGPSTQQIVAVVTLLPLGGFLLLLSAVTFFASLLGLAVSTPVFVIFSPIILPAAFVIFMAVAGFLTSGACGITGLSSLTWLANFVRRIAAKLPEQADQAKRRVQETAGYLDQKARETGQTIPTKAQEVSRAQDGGGRPTQEGGRAQEEGKAQEAKKT